MPSGARQAAALWCAVAALCGWQVLMQVDALLCCYFFVWAEESRDKKLNLARLAVAAS